MQQRIWRQAGVAGLVLLLLIVGVRTAWYRLETRQVMAQLDGAERWLNGTIIVVDPGHGGADPGAVQGSTLEKTLVLDISLQLKEILEAHGAKVYLTRDRDQSLGGSMRTELGRRVEVARRHNAYVYVSIHANKDRCNCWGAQTFYQKNGLAAGQEMALAIQARLREMTPTTRSALPVDFYVLRNSPVPAAMVEVGFLTNAREHRQLKDPAYQRKLAVAVALGLADYFRSQVPGTESEGSVGS